MKKLLCVLALVLGVTAVNADLPPASIQPNALGLRLGGGSGVGFEVSYQKAMAPSNRLELDLGWNGGAYWSWIEVAGVYQWCWNINGGLNWYAGPGAQLGFYSYNNNNGIFGDDESGLTLGIGGQIGIEYDFNTAGAPILLSFDVRPMFGFISHGGLGYDGALSVRYTF